LALRNYFYLMYLGKQKNKSNFFRKIYTALLDNLDFDIELKNAIG